MNRPHSISTWSNKFLDIAAPAVHELRPADIYWGLASKFRYSGQTRGRLLTVSEHSIVVGRLSKGIAMGRGMDPRGQALCQAAGLVHDTAESFEGDVPSPVKKLVPGFAPIEAALVHAVSVMFNPNHKAWPQEVLDVVRSADRVCLAAEWNILKPRQAKPESIQGPYPALIEAAEEIYRDFKPHVGDVPYAAQLMHEALVEVFGLSIVGSFDDGGDASV
jgi:hypothetical protein